MPATATPRKQRASKLDKILPHLFDNPGATIPEMEKALGITIQPLYLFNALASTPEHPERTNKVQVVGTQRHTDENGKPMRGRPANKWDLTDETRAAIKKARKNERDRQRRANKKVEPVEVEVTVSMPVEPIETEQPVAA